VLDANAARYVARVLRLKEGDLFVAFDPASRMEADASIVRVTPREVVVHVDEPRAGAVVAPRDVTWVQGMAKGEKMDAIVRDATELGATSFVAAATERAVARVAAERGDARRGRWERIAREAARQSGRADAPRVTGPLDWDEALATVDEGAARFLLWESATEPLAGPLAEALADGRGLAFAVGPEGGITEGEARRATERGWRALSLGPLILRTETVAAAVLGAARVWSDAFAR
jgi:16S rRNA (uracil1498-N3)-methyltransferase